MEQIIDCCLQFGQYDKQGVLDLIHELKESNLDAVTAAKWILGVESREETIARIPTTAVHDGKTYKLEKVKLLEGKVYVTYPETNVRYFITDEDEENPRRDEYTKTVGIWESIDTWLGWAKADKK